MESPSREDSDDNEDGLFVRTEDQICLSTTTNISQARCYLVRSGHHGCYVEREKDVSVEPHDIWKYSFVIEEAISVHAIHGWKRSEKLGCRKMLLYGQAVLISIYGKMLRCLSYDTDSNVSDKEKHVNYQIGHTPRGMKETIDATCWFTIHPATKRKSGERVHVGDDVYFVNVATKRYLSILYNDSTSDENSDELNKAVATFIPWSWTINIVYSGRDKDKFSGYLNGGEAIQIKLLHSKDECLSVPLSRAHTNPLKSIEDNKKVCFEEKSVALELRSLWKLELFKVNFGGAFVQWEQPFRLSNLASGKYLGIQEDRVVLINAADANREISSFCFIKKSSPKKHVYIDDAKMGSPSIKFGESESLLYHFGSNTWIGLETIGRSARRRIGTVTSGPSSVFVYHQPPQNTTLIINRNYGIALSATLSKKIDTALRTLAHAMCINDEFKEVTTKLHRNGLMCFQEVISFLKCPNKNHMSDHDYQTELMFLRNRQKRMNNHGSVTLTFELLKLSVNHYSVHPSPLALEIQQYLCKMLAAFLTDNPTVCKEFASEKNLKSLIELLNLPYLTHTILEVFDCLLDNSPEVLSSLTEYHVESFVKLLNVNGRQQKIMKILGKLCVCQDITMRDKQQQVCQHLMKSTELLVHIKLMSQINCSYTNIFLDITEIKEKWYYEFHWKSDPAVLKPHLRVGYALFHMFTSHPSSNGQRLNEGGIGDDFASVGFDGKHIWLGGGENFSPNTYSKSPRLHKQQSCQKQSDDEVQCIGCCFDVGDRVFWFTLNGNAIPLKVNLSNIEYDNAELGEMFVVPAISMSGGMQRAEFRFGGQFGELLHTPPDGYSPIYLHETGKVIQVRPFVDLGDKNSGLLKGPQIVAGQIPFIPSVIEISQVEVTDSIKNLIIKLASHIHESWSFFQITKGWTCGTAIDFDAKTHPNLRPYDEIEHKDRWEVDKAETIVMTLAALGCTISESFFAPDLKYESLDSSKATSVNNYCPTHLIISVKQLPLPLLKLVDVLAENSHNDWAEKMLEKGFRYGLKDSYKAKTYKNLLPYQSLNQEARLNYWNIMEQALKMILTLGYNIQPSLFDLSQNLDESYAQIPFRTFRGQFIPYCTGHGKWYFSVKIVKGQLMRIGWITQDSLPSLPIGMDNHSYAIDGFRVCKWHDGNQEKFGQKWKHGDTIVCLLDLDQQTMSFAIGDSLLESPSQEIAAFRGMDRHKWYIPAVTLFLSEEVEWSFGKIDPDKEAVIASGYQGIETNIKSKIPVWYSDHSPIFESIGDNHPDYSAKYSPDSITVNTNKIGSMSCFRLCMGVPIVLRSMKSDVTELEERIVSYSVCFPGSQDTGTAFLGWCTPEMIYNENLWKTNIPDSNYVSKVQVLVRNERFAKSDEEWRLASEHCTGFIVKLSALVDEIMPFGKDKPIKTTCTVNVTNGDIKFFSEGYESHMISLKISYPTKLFPIVIVVPSQEEVCEFVFVPIKDCLSIREIVFGNNIDVSIKNNVLSSMKILHCSTATWRPMDTTSSSSCTFKSAESGFSFSQYSQHQQLCVTLPMEEIVLGFTELFEHQQLADFHLETFKTLKACCMHDNIEAGKEIRKIFRWEHLLYCIKSNHWDYNVRAAYFDLFNALELEHEVNSQLLVRNDHIFAIESDTFSESPSIQIDSCCKFSLSDDISLNSTGSKCSVYQFPVEQLKNTLFDFLENLMKQEVLTCRMLSRVDRNNIVCPLLVSLDSLIVLQLISSQDEMERLLKLLHPLFSKTEDIKPHQTLLCMASDESIRLVLCNLLEHLCDCQLQNRIEHVVKFAEKYVSNLQIEQLSRVDDTDLSPRVLQEINTPTEKQIEAVISFNNCESTFCPTSQKLRKILKEFNSKIIAHCGVPEGHISAKDQLEDNEGLVKKIQQLIYLIGTSQTSSNNTSKQVGRIVQLQEIIKVVLIKWAREGIKDCRLTEKVFSLLFRQFNETEELTKALSTTYVIEKVSDFCSKGIDEFRKSLSHIRNFLKIGMGEKEEIVLEKKLKTLQQSELFSRHPHLFRLTGVHLTVMNVIKSYLSFNSNLKGKRDFVKVRVQRKRKMAISKTGFSGPVEECCKFLQAFAKTSRQNQFALFEHIPYLLEQCSKSPERLSSDTCSPLDVASSIIRNNLDLALALTEDIFKQIMVLMEKMTYGYQGNGTESGSDTSHSGETPSFHSMSLEWSPFGSIKCLKFLYAAVWVNGETVIQNATVIVKLLIQYPDSLGPGTLGQNLGIVTIFQESLTLRIVQERQSPHLKHQETIRFEKDRRSPGSLNKKTSSSLNLNSNTADIALSFYTFLIRLFACCASRNDNTATTSILSQSDHVIPFLQSLISFDDLKTILSLPLCTNEKQGITLKQKQVTLLFLDRVYGITCPKYYLFLIENVFLDDIRSNLYLCQDYQSKYALVDFYRYLCDFVLPFLQHYSHMITTYTISETSVVCDFMKACHQIISGGRLSCFQQKKVDSWLVNVSQLLPPQAFLRLVPEFSLDLDKDSRSFNTALKSLTCHFEHFHAYYSQGVIMTTSNYSYPPGRQHKLFVILLFSKLLDATAHRPSSNKSAIMQCLKAMISAISPESFAPSLSNFSIFLNRLCYHKCPTICPADQSRDSESLANVTECRNSLEFLQGDDLDSSLVYHTDEEVDCQKELEIEIPPETSECIKSFAEHCHNQWVFNKQQYEYWMYGPTYDEDACKDPNLRPFSKLSKENQMKMINPIKRCIRELLLWGYVFTNKSPFPQESLPKRQQVVCIRIRKKKNIVEEDYTSFAPVVVDLDKVEFPNKNNFKVVPEVTAIVLSDLLHICGSKYDNSSVYNPLQYLYKGDGFIETSLYISNMLKYFHIKGLICCGAFTALPSQLMMKCCVSFSDTIKYAPFGQQLFDNLLHLLNIQMDADSSHSILFPLVLHYLDFHSSYYNPRVDDRERTQLCAIPLEKIQISKMLSRLHQYLREHLDSVLHDPVSTVGRYYKPPTLLSVKESNDVQLERIVNLSLALVKALDMNQKEVLDEISSFIQSVSAIFEDFPTAVEKEATLDQSTVSDMKYILFCLHCLIPVLSYLFSQLRLHKTSGSKDHFDVVSANSLNIFSRLFYPTETYTTIFIKNNALTNVGQCLASLSSFVECQLDVFGKNIPKMVGTLKWAAAKRLSPQATSFVGSVIVPLLKSTFDFKGFTNTENSIKFFKLCLRIVHEYQGEDSVDWIFSVCASLASIAHLCNNSMFSTHILPLVSSLAEHGNTLWQTEQVIFPSVRVVETNLLKKQRQHTKYLKIFARDVTAIMLFLLKFLTSRDLNLEQSVGKIYMHEFVAYVSNILDYYYSSQRFASQLNLCNKSIALPLIRSRNLSNTLLLCADVLLKSLPSFYYKLIDDFQKLFSENKTNDVIESNISQVLVVEESFNEYSKQCLEENKFKNKKYQSSKKRIDDIVHIMRIMAYTKYYINQSQRSNATSVIRGRWRTVLTRQRREAILLCLKAVPFHKLKRHRAVNLFLNEYSKGWLSSSKDSNMERLCDRLLDQEDYELIVDKKLSALYAHRCDPLTLLCSMFKTLASTQRWDNVNGSLYEAYCLAIVQTTQWVLEEDTGKEGESAAKAYERFHNRLGLATKKQKQLLLRGVPGMILSVLAASEGNMTELVHLTIKLGLVVLEGGNTTVQQTMLEELSSMDVDVVTSIRDLVSSCNVLDWASYERNYNSASFDNSIAKKVFSSSDEVLDLFRFLQLLCEGHNEDFQNYLRTQDRSSTTVNIVVASVDYLLKLQESVRDFYWHHAHHESLELPARDCFFVSFQITRQVFRTLTEYIQGPCIGNQQALSQSRLWDAISGYLHIFTSLQHKLFAHTNHMELLREVLNLEEEFFILLLSMLEGVTMSSSIGRHMLNMFLENENYLTLLIKFYNIFIKLADTTTSNAFKEYDLDKDGFISYQEFEKAMNLQQHYSKDEIDYLMQLADTNKDGHLDYKEFTDRFHKPAHNLGFHLCALIQQLSDILPNDLGVRKLTELGRDLFEHFDGRMGCVEIVGKSTCVERVYFRIKQSRSLQWSDRNIKESRMNFIYDIEANNQREKLEGFVNFCENTIFELNYNDTLTGVEQVEQTKRAEDHRSKFYDVASPLSVDNMYDTVVTALKPKVTNSIFVKFQSLLSFIWMTILFGIIIKPTMKFSHFIALQVAFLWHKGEGRLQHRSFLSLSRQLMFKQPGVSVYIPRIVYSVGSIGSLLANSYYKIKKMLVVTTLLINLLILVSIENETHWSNVNEVDSEKDETTVMRKTLEWLTFMHFILSFTSILSFWNRKGQLILFKEEKKTARRLEQQRILTRPYNTLKFMDRIIIKSPSFPRHFWDKQVKERVLNRASEDQKESISKILGKKVWSEFDTATKNQQLGQLLNVIIDARYHFWRLVVVIQEPQILHHIIYCVLSFAGVQLNVFYFSIHLLDLMFQSKILVTVLKSLKINMKQLIMTLAMTCVVLYIYAVIGFNFFRRFYQYELSGGQIQDNCDSMWNCFFFHLDKGLRSGGGIADVLVSATGDNQYMLRLSFDMTFFFIVIVILLAVFQGLIIDAFGELRKKQDSVTEELQMKCFICGINVNEFISSQEFDNHIHHHHSMRDYMFFMMHLIEKPETEFTGQESHVWDLYLQQKWAFFPSGTCFQIQEKQRLLEKAEKRRQQALNLALAETNDTTRVKRSMLSNSRHSKTVTTF